MNDEGKWTEYDNLETKIKKYKRTLIHKQFIELMFVKELLTDINAKLEGKFSVTNGSYVQ